MSKNKGFLVGLNLLLLISCLGIMHLGASQPKKSGLLNLCELKAGERGILKGVVVSVEKSSPGSGKAIVTLTEGSQGCHIMVYQRYNQLNEMGTPGNRVKVPVKVINDYSVEGIGLPEFDYSVVDTSGNIEKPKMIKLTIGTIPNVDNGDYLEFRNIDEGKIPYIERLKISKKLNSQLKLGNNTIYYSETTKEVLAVEN
ncbi:hypothetical protein NIES2100_19200 [Calothrix sp. NIES-2100]|uniref:hypothetical protein n=1 Tax=Calothrix sp. NIES-2100 TaxID=1954172 RepID=UPI000B617D9B|nr:hypothetical protein NIES2100_19200 [Calothrix sp. NIES-2100]